MTCNLLHIPSFLKSIFISSHNWQSSLHWSAFLQIQKHPSLFFSKNLTACRVLGQQSQRATISATIFCTWQACLIHNHYFRIRVWFSRDWTILVVHRNEPQSMQLGKCIYSALRSNGSAETNPEIGEDIATLHILRPQFDLPESLILVLLQISKVYLEHSSLQLIWGNLVPKR